MSKCHIVGNHMSRLIYLIVRRPGRSRMLDTEYVCTLKARDLKKAKDELNEDPKQRLGAVQSLREWVQREPWINAPTGKYLKVKHMHGISLICCFYA